MCGGKKIKKHKNKIYFCAFVFWVFKPTLSVIIKNKMSFIKR